jgi:hypothetical protein
VVEGSAE